MTAISVCIPTYEMHGHGAAFLTRALVSLDAQTFRDFEVVVSDHSQDFALESVCRERRQFYPLRYVRCAAKRGNSSANSNFAVRHARGDIVKMLHQDDFLFSDAALDRIAQAMHAAPDRHWGGTGCIHVNETETAFHSPLVPKMSPRMLHGDNTFGAPSLMFVRRASFLAFDEELIWVMDCEAYHRLQQAWGEPLLLPDALVAVRQWSGQMTHTAVSEERKHREIAYALRKHAPVSQPREP